MVKRVGSIMRKSRQKLSKSIREKGKLRISSFLQSFKTGDRVALKVEPGYQRGQYNLRFHGKTGTVKKQVGTCYEVKIMDASKEKTVVVHPVHLKRVE